MGEMRSRSDEQGCRARLWAQALSARTARTGSSTRDTARARLGPSVPSRRPGWSRCQRSVVKISPWTRFPGHHRGREWTSEQSRAGVYDLDEVLHRW